MKRLSTITLLLFLAFALIGCSSSPVRDQGGYLTKKQVLKNDPNADWLEFEGKVYKTNVDWSDEEKMTKGEKLGEVTEGMASHIPSGAEIYESNERGDVLIVDYMKVEKQYLLQIGE